MRTLADATNVIAEGEVLQLLNIHDPDVDEARYMQVIRYKTAKLFEASARLGARSSPAAPRPNRSRGPSSARASAPHSSSIDDVLDYSGVTAEIGKNVGDDLREGKPTLPLIYLLERGSAGAAGAGPGHGDRQPHADWPASRPRSTPAARSTTRARWPSARRAAARAVAERLPESPYKRSLLELCSFAIHRDY